MELHKIPTQIDGLQLEEPFLKIEVGNPGSEIVICKDEEDYTVHALDPETQQVTYPKTKMNGEFWQSQRKTSSLFKDLKAAGILPEDAEKKEFRIEIAKYLQEQLETWTDIRASGDYQPEDTLEERYNRSILDDADKLLKEEDILKEVKAILDYKIAGEDRTKLGLFLQLLTKDFDEPLMIYGIQKQGEGKSFVAKKVLELFPDHMVETLTDATKSSIYRIAETEGSDYFDDKVVFFGEIPEQEEDRGVFQIFRELVSEGEVSKRLTLESGDEGGYESRRLELEGAPAMISTTVDASRIDDQDLSRGVTYSPSMKDEQYEQVREYQNVSEELPDEVIIPDEIERREKVVKAAIDKLSQKEVKIKNPFTRNIDELIPDDTDNIKRDYPKVLRIVGRVPTYLYHRQRPSIVAGDQKYYLTEFIDVIRGLMINKEFINGMIEGRVKSTLDAYEVIKDQTDPIDKDYKELERDDTNPDEWEKALSFTNQDLQKWMGIGKKTAMNYTRRLSTMRLIYKDSSRKPHKHYLLDTKIETKGITPRSLLKITASVLEQEKFRDWFKSLINFFDIECTRDSMFDDLTDNMVEELGLEIKSEPVEGKKLTYSLIKDALPPNYPFCYQFDTTLELLETDKNSSSGFGSDYYPHLPLYMKNSGSAKTLPKSFNVGIKGNVIFIELRGKDEAVIAREEMEWEPLKQNDFDSLDGSSAVSENNESVQSERTSLSEGNKQGSSRKTNNHLKEESSQESDNKKTENETPSGINPRSMDKDVYLKEYVNYIVEQEHLENGVDRERVLEDCVLDYEIADKIVDSLISNGELFDPKPGKLKKV